jgi:hypothetical protein
MTSHVRWPTTHTTRKGWPRKEWRWYVPEAGYGDEGDQAGRREVAKHSRFVEFRSKGGITDFDRSSISEEAMLTHVRQESELIMTRPRAEFISLFANENTLIIPSCQT